MPRCTPIRAAVRRRMNEFTAALLLAVFPGAMLAQTAVPQPGAPSAGTAAQATVSAPQAKPPTGKDRRRAVKLYLSTSKLYTAGRFEEAMHGYQQAAALDPTRTDYRLAAEVARSHAVTALVQAATKDRISGNPAAARAALAHALELDPRNFEATQHLYELGDDAVRGLPRPFYDQEAEKLGPAEQLAPVAGLHSFHFRSDQRQIIQQVFKAYGLETTLDESVHSARIRFDIDDASFREAVGALNLITGTFYVPLDAHRVLVARDTHENRQQFTPLEVETVYLPGLATADLTEVSNLAKNVFSVQQATIDSTAETITLHAPADTLSTFNTTLSELLDGRSQILLDVRVIQVAHTSTRDTGVVPPQSFTAFNIYGEEESILSSNSTLVNEIVSSGLASSSDPLAIIAILLASGEVSSSLFSGGIALFGGGITESALSFGSTTANFSLNSSESRALDQLQLRLGDGEEGTLRLGERYPIQTSSYSSLTTSSSSIAGLTASGTSSSLSSLASSLTSTDTVPQVEYQDLGLTLKATPGVTRNNEVALSIDMKITALSGSSVNGNPVLNNRAYSGVVTLKQGEAVVVASELNKTQSRAISGTPEISEIPGLNDLTGKDIEKDYATLLIVITPHVIRGTQAAGHSPMMHVEKSTTR
jgi:general secretion pathway protein D